MPQAPPQRGPLRNLDPVPPLLARTRAELREAFDFARPVRVSRAPGRLDVIGGIADYTGSLVCEMPLDRAAAVVMQARSDREIQIFSFNLLDEHRPTRTMHVVVRAAAPALLGQAIREAIAEVDPDLPAYQLRTVTAAMEDENSSNVLLSGMFVAFAAIAVLLAMAGLYGVMSYAVSQRSGEIAVRLALGAPTRVIARQVIGQSVTLAAIGIAIGAVCAYILARSIASLLFGVRAADVTTYGASVALTLAAAVVATWLPMRRAATIDPLESLRRT